jgi:hypothetical protein
MGTFTVKSERRGRVSETSGTIEELVKYFSYTLEVGESWQHEKGNKKINRNPKSIKSLISNLNNAKTNSAANGCSDTYYSL